MKTLFFKGDIDEDNVSSLILAIEEVNQDAIIYFTSKGGNDYSENILVDQLADLRNPL